MTRFRCVPIETATADRFRRTGFDDRGNPIRRIMATASGQFPCRHCLKLAKAGESMLLGSYDLRQPLGIYWTPSPIFLHERECPYTETVDAVAPIVHANPLVSVRAYDADHLCLYDLGRSAQAAMSRSRFDAPSTTRGRSSSTSTPPGPAVCCRGWNG